MLAGKYKKKFDKFICKSISKIYDKPLAPPTEKENECIKELRKTFSGIEVKDATDCNPSERVWLDSVKQIKELVLNDDPREFLRWHVVSSMMFAKFSSYVAFELKYIKRHPEWINRWSKAIQENPVGHPLPYGLYPKSSANLIHHAYHLAVFEDKTGTRLNDLNLVFEFGGGYGSMCRLFHNLGFRGKYVIFDLPHISALQKFYLNSIQVNVCSSDLFEREKSGVFCISDVDTLNEVLSTREAAKDSLFLATWSISEVPVSVRNTILPLVSPFDKFLIAYQDQFQEVNNIGFFNQWKSTYKGIEWQEWEIEHLRKNRYLLGERK